jgi:hypothetical protein
MAARTCHRCGAPAGVASAPANRPVFCCAGCLVASQIPVDAKGNYPVNAALVTVLAVGFVVFNQLLGWGLVDFMADQGRARAAALCAFASLGAGAFAGMIAVREQVRGAGGVRVLDSAVVAVAILLVAIGVALGAPGFGVTANALLLGWCCRGLLRKKRVRNPDDPV